MSKLLVEKLAAAFGLDPSTLSSSQYRNLCIIIDFTLEIKETQKNSQYNPFNKLLSHPNILEEKEVENLLIQLAAANKEGIFTSLEASNPPLEEILEKLCQHLEVKDSNLIGPLLSNVPSDIKEYERALAENKSAYTEGLQFKRDSTQTLATLKKFSSFLSREYEILCKKPFPDSQALAFAFNEEQSMVEVKNLKAIHFLPKSDKKGYFLNKSDASLPPPVSLIKHLLITLSMMNQLKKELNCKAISEENVKEIIAQLKPLFRENLNLSPTDQRDIRDLLKKVHDFLPRNDSNRKALAELISAFVMEYPSLRSWKKLQEFKDKDMIHRVILLSKDDIADAEVNATLALMIKKHPRENIVITFEPKDVIEINRRNKLNNVPFTLQVVGHGSLKQEDHSINANLGPFRGSALETGKKVAELVNKCPLIDHVRLTGCFTARVQEEADLEDHFFEKDLPSGREDRTLTTIPDAPLSKTQVFLPQSAIVSCWDNINKENREIYLTASPGIIEADNDAGHMVWRSSDSKKRVDDHVKDIHISTPKSRKAQAILQQYQTQVQPPIKASSPPERDRQHNKRK